MIMDKIFQGNVSCDATATGTIYVRAESRNKAPIALLDAAPDLIYELHLNPSYSPSEFFFGSSDDEVCEVQIVTPSNYDEWNILDNDALLCWPENAEQPYTKENFVSLARNNDEWAFKLYDAFIHNDAEICPETYLEETPLEEIIFGSETNIQRLLRILAISDCITVDHGALLSSWDDSEVINDPNNEVLNFSWVDADGNQYASILTEEGISQGSWVDDSFICDDRDGDETILHFFQLTATPHLAEIS